MVDNIVVNYSLEVFHDQTVTDIYSYFLDFTLLLNTLCLPIMSYVIMTQSSKMGPYKWFLLSGLIWDYALDLIISMLKPVFLFPFYMAYMNGLFKYFITQQGIYIIMAIIFFIYINMEINQFFSFLYRLAHISPLGAVEFFETPRRIFPTMIAVHLLFYICFVTPIAFFQAIPLEDWAKAIETEAPVLIEFLKNYPAICGTPYNKAMPVVMIVISGVLIGETAILLFSFVYFYKKLQEWKKTISLSTYKLQMMLFAALVAQLTNIIIFLNLPLTVVYFMASGRYKYSSYMGLLGVCMISLHSLADIITIIYFIKPYRMFFGRMLGILSKKLPFSQNNSAAVEPLANQMQVPPNQRLAISSAISFSQVARNLQRT